MNLLKFYVEIYNDEKTNEKSLNEEGHGHGIRSQQQADN